jgi:non-ribosomal peptide synthase protein (TIGR01720 family)
LDIRQQLRATDGISHHWDLLRSYANDAKIRAEASSLPAPAVAFNYFGQLDSALGTSGLFELRPLPHGELHSPRSRREHLIEIDTVIQNGMLEIRITYWRELQCTALMQCLPEASCEYLRAASSDLARGKTMREFESTELGSEEWQAAIAEVDFITGEARI